MAKTAADVLVETLLAWGIDTIFGIPGDGVNGVIEALRKRQDRIRFIQVRHEESAAFMACAWAKFTGRIGCCIATSGPGGIHLLNGLYDAKLDGQPVLAITGMQYHDLIGTATQQDVELDKVFVDVCVYNQRVMGAAHVENVASLACRMALSKRGVSHITIPIDMQSQAVNDDERSKRNLADHVSQLYSRSARLPNENDVRAAAGLLNAGKKVAILAGRGALNAGAELEQVAELLGAPVIKALLGKACIPDDSPYTTGALGLLGTEPSQNAIESCDTLFIIGSSFPYIEYYPKPGQAKCVQIDLDPGRISLRYPADVAMIGDCRESLQLLIPHLQRKEDRSFLEQAQQGMQEWRQLMETRGTDPAMPMRPQVVAHEVGRRLRDDAIVCSDSGTNTVWWARHIPAKAGQMHSCSGTLASMACGLPYAIAAQLAYPDRQVVAFVGDGGFSMLMAEVATAVKYKLPIKVVIVKNNSLGQIKWEQLVFDGNPEYVCDLEPIDFSMIARACGAASYFIDNPAQCGSVVEQALNTPGPVVIEAVVDPNTPPLPGKVKPEQALHFAEALARGTQDASGILKSLASEKIRELI